MADSDDPRDDNRRPDRPRPEPPARRGWQDPWRLAEAALNVLWAYLVLSGEEAATVVVTTLLAIIRLMRR
jgi:hypothetical protein